MSKAQKRLTYLLQKIFPEQDMISNYKHKEMANQEFDVFIPALKLAFEYQVHSYIENLTLQENNITTITLSTTTTTLYSNETPRNSSKPKNLQLI